MYKIRFINKYNRNKIFIRTLNTIEDIVSYVMKIYGTRMCAYRIYDDLTPSEWAIFIRKLNSYAKSDAKNRGLNI